MAQAVRENSEVTFKISDIRAGKSILSYFQSKLLRSRAAGFSTVHAQLIQVYMGLDASLRRDLFEPTPATSVDQYRELLMEKEEIWTDIYNTNRSSRTLPQTQRAPYQPRATYPTPFRSIANQPSPSTPTPPTGRQSNSPQARSPQQVTSPPNARLPCPFHAARNQTHYHSPMACRLPEARNLLSGSISRIQQINFQAHSENVQESEDNSTQSSYEEIPQYA
jgi:hypothetical protein